MAGLEFADVAAALTCEQFARRELPMRGNRAKCPWCDNPTRYNLKVDERCYCFSCHKTGDVVTLAAAVWHTNQLDAARQLNDEYRLGLTGSTPTDEQRQRRQREREQREEEAERQRREWGKAADDLREAERAAAGLVIEDADKPATWATVARLAAAQDKWNRLWAGV